MRAIVFSGGGAKGAFGVGVLSQLRDVKYDIALGTSAGSLNAAGFSHLGFDGLKKLWMGINSKFDVLSWSMSRKGVFDLDPLEKIIKKVVRKPYVVPAYCCAVRLEDGNIVYSDSSDVNFSKMIIASCSIPGAIVPVELEDSTYADGGIRENCPVSQAIAMGADEIDAILCNPFEPLQEWTLPPGDLFPMIHLVARAYELMSHEALINDLVHREGVKINVYAPHIEPCGVFDFDHESIMEAYEMGVMSKPISI